MNDLLKVFMLQSTIEGKQTSSRDTVAESKLYWTVASLNSEFEKKQYIYMSYLPYLSYESYLSYSSYQPYLPYLPCLAQLSYTYLTILHVLLALLVLRVLLVLLVLLALLTLLALLGSVVIHLSDYLTCLTCLTRLTRLTFLIYFTKIIRWSPSQKLPQTSKKQELPSKRNQNLPQLSYLSYLTYLSNLSKLSNMLFYKLSHLEQWSPSQKLQLTLKKQERPSKRNQKWKFFCRSSFLRKRTIRANWLHRNIRGDSCSFLFQSFQLELKLI